MIIPKHILLVDDDPVVCDSIRRMLALDQHLVEMVCDGEHALSLFKNGKFDLVITDFVMPVMKGDALAATIKSLNPKQPVVLVTAFAEMLQTCPTGVDQIISKPCDLSELRKAIATLTSDSN